MSIFKKKIEKNTLPTKSTKEIIEEIHETFYSEVDKLLAEAKIMNTVETDRQPLIDKSARLEKLGFGQSKECKEAKKEIERLDKLKLDNLNKKTLIEAINYFSFKYPQYKFITEDSVKKICEKYNLVYGEVSRYIGEIPTKNLEDMEKFTISDDDVCCIEQYRSSGGYRGTPTFRSFTEQVEKDKKDKEWENSHSYMPGLRGGLLSFGQGYTFKGKCPLEIAAPLKDFNTQGMEVKDFKLSNIEIPDPVVLQPVIYDNTKYYLIVTAWGEEGSDELVVNQKMN